MAIGTDELDAINSAIASGVLTVRHADGRQVTFRSMTELKEARDDILERQRADCGTRKRRTMRVQQTGRGY